MDASKKNYKYGITGPLSTKESTEAEHKVSEDMDKYLWDCGFFEDDSEGQTRERVLGKLNFMVREFVARIGKDKSNLSLEKSYGGKIFTFGSYRLGVHDKGADIDALCIVPRHVTRNDFFTHFYETLKEDPNIDGITKIEEAFVPIIKFKFQGIPIDLVFARLNLPAIKDGINLLNNTLLKNMDEKCILSLNGSRVTDEMLSLVPNVQTFHSALRCIKYWAKRRCVYGNPYGYFGGVAFSLCVARVCQLYPNASSFVVVCKFFELFSSWKWPTPVLLRPVVDLNYNLKVWDPKIYPSDKYHRMPVITPSYPSMCATHNVSNSTQHLVTKELIRAHEILAEPGQDMFKKLFTLSDFFNRYKLFIQILTMSIDEEAFSMWEGYIESKVRILGSKFEAIEDITYAIPFPKAFRISTEKLRKIRPGDEDIRKCTAFFIAIDVIAIKGKKVFVDQPVRDFTEFVCEYEKKQSSMMIEINSLRRKDMQNFLKVFYGREGDKPKEDGSKRIKSA